MNKFVALKQHDLVINLIIILESVLIGLSLIFPVEITKYLLFSIVGLSLYFGLISIHSLLSNFPKVSLVLLLYVIMIVATLIYTGFIRKSFPSAMIFISSVTLLLGLYNNGLGTGSVRLLMVCVLGVVLFGFIKLLSLNSINAAIRYLISSFGNPNMVGIILSALIMLEIVGIFFFQNRAAKLGFILLSAFTVYLLFQTRNRGSIVALGVLALLLVIYHNGQWVGKTTRGILILFPLLFALLYTGLLQELPKGGEFLQKPFFSGREIEWKYLLDHIFKDPLSINLLPSGGLNLFLNGIIDFGFIAFSIYIILLFLLKPDWNTSKKLDYKKVAYLSFLCVFIQQAFESTLITGSFGINVYSYLLFGISCTRDQESLE